MKILRLFCYFVLPVIFVAPVLADSAGPDSVSEEIEYFATFMQGKKIGYAIQKHIVSEGKVTTSEEGSMTLSRTGIPVTVKTREKMIETIDGKDKYLDAMQGKMSYMRYFKGSLWDALAKDYAAKLAASLKETELTPNLKRWRDRIIQDSIAEGRITEANSYTRYVDALVMALRKEQERKSFLERNPFVAMDLRTRIEEEPGAF